MSDRQEATGAQPAAPQNQAGDPHASDADAHGKGHADGRVAAGHAHAHAGAHGHRHSHGHAHAHTHGAGLRAASTRALWLALVVLSVCFVVEIAGGLLANSLALISDAAHLLTDVAAVGLALFAQWFARKPGTAARSFGYRRVEILAALGNGFTLLGVAVYIAYEAWKRLQSPPEVLGGPVIIVASIGLVAQVATTLILRGAAGESLNVRGAYVHAMTDAVQSVGVIVAGVVIVLTGWYTVDVIASVLIVLLVLYSGGKIAYEATHVLIEGTPREVNLDRLAALLQGTPGVLRVTDLHAWSLTSGYNALSAHIEALPDEQDVGYERLRRRLVELVCGNFPLQHVTLQIERECSYARSECCSWLNQKSSGVD